MKKYRSLKDIHLGNSEFAIKVGDIVQFDGSKLILPSGVVVPLATPSSLVAAINMGWLVLCDDDGEEIEAPAAPAPRSPAQAAQAARPGQPAPKFATVQRAEQVMGGLNDVRGPKAPAAHQASNAASTISRAAPTGAMVAPQGMFDAPLSVGGKPSKGFQRGAVVQEGTGAEQTLVPARRFSTTAKGEVVKIGVNDGDALRAAQAATNRANQKTQTNFDAKKLAEALPDKFEMPEEEMEVDLGDGDEMLAGGELEEILPNAVSTGKPPTGVYKEGAIVGRGGGDSDFSTADDGKVIGKIGEAHAASLAPKVDIDPMAAALAEVAGEEIDLTPSDTDIDIPALLAKARLEVVAHLVPEGFTWDTSPHWKARAKLAVDLYRDFPNILMAIMALEVRAVQQEILKRMFGEAKAPANVSLSRVTDSDEMLSE